MKGITFYQFQESLGRHFSVAYYMIKPTDPIHVSLPGRENKLLQYIEQDFGYRFFSQFLVKAKLNKEYQNAVNDAYNNVRSYADLLKVYNVIYFDTIAEYCISVTDSSEQMLRDYMDAQNDLFEIKNMVKKSLELLGEISKGSTDRSTNERLSTLISDSGKLVRLLKFINRYRIRYGDLA